MNCLEERVDMRKISQAERDRQRHSSEIMFRLNHSMPASDEYLAAMGQIVGAIGEGSYITAPVQGVCWYNMTIGTNVYVGSNMLAMARGGITIGDDVMIAANVQLLTNNHDMYDRQILLCKPIVIREGAWIGAGATIMPGVSIGRYAVVGACAVVTKDVPDYAVVVGMPAQVAETLDASRFPPEF